MDISSVSSQAVSNASTDSAYSVAVAKKSLDATKLQGQNALTLIQGAAAPQPAALQAGQTFSAVL